MALVQVAILAVVAGLVWFRMPMTEEHISDRYGSVNFITSFPLDTRHPRQGAQIAVVLSLRLLPRQDTHGNTLGRSASAVDIHCGGLLHDRAVGHTGGILRLLAVILLTAFT
ncbi:hypothetical protein BC937DRAFT_87935, partial [Endogone sp. FLAS-F59071]